MKTQRLGTSDLVSTRLSFGNMRCLNTWNTKEVDDARMEQGITSHIAAYESGYTLFDTADIYCHTLCEVCLGKTLARVKGMRENIIIATKCGIRFENKETGKPHQFDFSSEHILASCEGSLKRMGIDTIDLYHLHRPDLLMNPPEVAKVFEQLHRAGKVRYFAVSNFLPSFVSALQAYLPWPLIVNQVEIHLGRLDCFYDGTLDQCIERKITPLSWSPLGGGFLGDGKSVSEKHPRRAVMESLVKLLDEIALRLGTTRSILSLAWLLKHPSGIIPIVGSSKPERLKDAVKADDLEISRDDWYRILVAARGERLP